MSAFDEILAALERGEFVNHHGRLVVSLGDDSVARSAKNILEHHNREAMRRRNEVIARLNNLRGKKP